MKEDSARKFIRESTLEELKDSLKIIISRAKTKKDLSMICLSFGKAMVVRVPDEQGNK